MAIRKPPSNNDDSIMWCSLWAKKNKVYVSNVENSGVCLSTFFTPAANMAIMYEGRYPTFVTILGDGFCVGRWEVVGDKSRVLIPVGQANDLLPEKCTKKITVNSHCNFRM